MKSAIHTKRKTDAVIAIRQDNSAKKIFITNMNKAAETLVGYIAKDLIGQSFSNIMPPRINELINSYIEFENGSSDFAMVARRIPNFQILSKKGEIVPVSLKIFNLVGRGENIQEYELLMRDVTLITKIEELKEIIKSSETKIEERDLQTGLPNINSIVYSLETSYSFLDQHSAIAVCFALIEIGNIGYYGETYGEYVAYEIIGTLGQIVKKCCRDEDNIAYMGDGVIGVVLIDCNIENAKVVLNRVRSKVSNAKISIQSGQQISLSLRISYTQIQKGQEMENMIDICEDGLNRIAQNNIEGLVQV